MLGKIGTKIFQGVQQIAQKVGKVVNDVLSQLQELFPQKDSFQSYDPTKEKELQKTVGSNKESVETNFAQQNGITNIAEPASKEFVVEVRSGDTLSKIAQRYGMDWRELAQHNNLSNPDLIFPGQKIKIPQEFSPNNTSQTSPSQPQNTLNASNNTNATLDSNNTSSNVSNSSPIASSGTAHDVAVDQLIDYVAVHEGGGKYDAWNSNDVGAGVSFGLIQFNQKKGGLPTLLQDMYNANPEKFNEYASQYGVNPNNFTDESWVRSANLNSSNNKNFMLALARDPEFQKVQRDVARKEYFEPTNAMSAEYGIDSERGRAIMFDISVQFGPDGLADILSDVSARHPNVSESELLQYVAYEADGRVNEQFGWNTTRRIDMLGDPNLSDAPMD